VPLPALPGVDVRHRRVAISDGTHLHVAEAGDGPPLVLLHGWPQHWWAWRRVVPALAQSHRVLCADLRGLGWSDAPPGGYAKEALAGDVLALLDALDLGRVALCGHDWGGLVAALVALRAPGRVSHLAVLSMLHPWPADARPPAGPRLLYQVPLATPGVGERILRHLPAYVRAIIRRGGHPATRWTPTELDAYAEVLRAPARARATGQLYRTFLLGELRPLLRGRYAGRRLTMPVLMLAGEADPVAGPWVLGGLARHADRPAAAVVAGAGHFPAEEQPAAVVGALSAHLRR
jgi:pimeloyl-ACP methyl ester carboxylesterase